MTFLLLVNLDSWYKSYKSGLRRGAAWCLHPIPLSELQSPPPATLPRGGFGPWELLGLRTQMLSLRGRSPTHLQFGGLSRVHVLREMSARSRRFGCSAKWTWRWAAVNSLRPFSPEDSAYPNACESLLRDSVVRQPNCSSCRCDICDYRSSNIKPWSGYASHARDSGSRRTGTEPLKGEFSARTCFSSTARFELRETSPNWSQPWAFVLSQMAAPVALIVHGGYYSSGQPPRETDGTT